MSGTIAILGGCGGIGRVLVNNAVKIGYEVHVMICRSRLRHIH